MPELPEVETTVRGINAFLLGKTIRGVWSDYFSVLYPGKLHIKNRKFFPTFKKRVIGGKIIGAGRRGKNILIELDNGNTIIVHMKMTGHLLYGAYRRTTLRERRAGKEFWVARKPGALQDPRNRFIHLVFELSDGKCLVLSDLRKFATVTALGKERLTLDTQLHLLGPDPLKRDFTLKTLLERLKEKKNLAIKKVLMDQKVLAGIGNIYSDEILWRIGVHPETKIENIPPHIFKKMLAAMKALLKKGINFGGDSTSDYRNLLGERGKFQATHEAYRRTGQKCQKSACGGIIKRIVVGQRSAHFCPKHQKILQ